MPDFGLPDQHGEVQTLSSILDIEPKPDIHVYAPGAEVFGYRVVSFTLEEESFFRALPIEYPLSEIYHFVALDEHVPVYQAPFRIVQEIVLRGTPEVEKSLGLAPGRNLQGQVIPDVETPDVLAVTGTLDYQACDDEVCFNPVSVPVSWTVALVPPDLESASRR